MPGDVTGIVVCYRSSADELERCIASLEASPDVVETLLLNNDSADTIPSTIASRHRVRLTVAPRNFGFCDAVNQLFANVSTDYVLLLNPDAFVDGAFVRQLRDRLDADPTLASAGGRLMRSTDGRGTSRVDSLGVEMRPGRRPADIAHGRTYRRPRHRTTEVFGVTAAAAMYRVSALREVAVVGEVLPGRFFMYLDDVDLAWRLRRHGYSSVVDHNAIAYHARALAGEEIQVGSSFMALIRRIRTEVERPDYVRRLSWSNHLLMLVRNEEPDQLLRSLPQLLLRRMPSDALMIVQAPRVAISARLRFLSLLPWALRQRRLIRSKPASKNDVERWLR